MDIRIGNGFDVHAFEEGNFVILGGVKIPHTHKLSGHSDADVVLHAITDAIFGALAQGDILNIVRRTLRPFSRTNNKKCHIR